MTGSAYGATPPATEAPRVSIERLNGIQWQSNGASVDLVLRIGNPKGVNLPLQGLHFQCLFGDTAVAQGQSTAAVEIPANGSALVPVQVDIDAVTLTFLGAAISSGAPLPYRIEGIAEVGITGIPVPFVRTGILDLARARLPAGFP